MSEFTQEVPLRIGKKEGKKLDSKIENPLSLEFAAQQLALNQAYQNIKEAVKTKSKAKLLVVQQTLAAIQDFIVQQQGKPTPYLLEFPLDFFKLKQDLRNAKNRVAAE